MKRSSILPERFLMQPGDYLVALLAMFAAIWGGLVSYFRRIQSGEQHSRLAAIAHIATSGFAGFIAWLGCVGAEVPAPFTGVICGLAGHMGAEFIRLLDHRFTDRLK
ncbi:phage holin family protein [Thauera humireducens]|uniref:phage holin family protein n=1 Tax=Thauera humireducens TaxID=1134435 RepID=UPI0009EEBA5E|nr:phage holin family protein [Thauera humireducens]